MCVVSAWLDAWLRGCVALGLGSLGAWQAATMPPVFALATAGIPRTKAHRRRTTRIVRHSGSATCDTGHKALMPGVTVEAGGPAPGPGRGATAPAPAWDAPRRTQRLHYSSWRAAQWH